LVIIHFNKPLPMKRLLFLTVLLTAYTVSLNAQLFNKKVNQFGEDKKRTGKWISYWDDDKRVPMSKAFYKNGYETRVSKEYHYNGVLRLKFRYYPKKMRVKYFREDGSLEQKGWAVIEYNAEDTHYYWHGPWKYYDTNRKLIKKSIYANSELIDEVIY